MIGWPPRHVTPSSCRNWSTGSVTQSYPDFYGVVNVTKAVVPILREQGSGHNVQISSLSARWSSPG